MSTDTGHAALAAKALLVTIAGYRAVVSPWLPARCRFHPTCSAYAAEAIATHGALTGARLAASRLARCHPWHAGGYDPVPAADAASTGSQVRPDRRPRSSRHRAASPRTAAPAAPASAPHASIRRD